MSQSPEILIADDEPAIRLLLETILTSHGYRVTVVDNGTAALKAAAGRRFDLVITDLMMPGTDGIELILALRGSHPDTPVIAMSGGWNSGARSYLPLATKIGATLTLEKPFNCAVLLDAVRQALGQVAALSA